MLIRERRLGNVTILDLCGRLTVTGYPCLLKEIVTRLVRHGRRSIVLNLIDLTYVDSSCLGELVDCYVTATRAGSGLKLAGADERLRRLLGLSQLTFLTPYESEDAAVASFMAGVA